MNELWQAFILGNSAILTNVCILPLYPGLIAYMAGNAHSPESQKAGRWLGLFVLAGVLTLMLVVGGILFYVQRSFSTILPFLLPAIYVIVVAMGILMLSGRNPFSRLATVQVPIMRNPYVGAYVYGLLLGPMTLPCAGPIVVSAFLLGAGSFVALADGIAYFVAFGLGFGWPLVLIPFLAAPFQQRLTRWTTRNYTALTRVSGALLIAIGIFGLTTEVFPNITFT